MANGLITGVSVQQWQVPVSALPLPMPEAQAEK
jgi:hypothetical protein